MDGSEVYFGSCSGLYYALDALTGALKWKYDTAADGRSNEFHSEPVLANHLVITGSDLRMQDGIGHVYAFDRATGEVQWKHDVPIGVPGRLLVGNSRVYAVDFGQSLLALDLQTGKQVQKIEGVSESKDFVFPPSPAARNNALFYATRKGTVRAIDMVSQKQIWERSLSVEITSDLDVNDKSIFLATADKRIVELDQQTGATIRSIQTRVVVRWKLAVRSNKLFFLECQSSSCGLLTCIDLETGKESWSRPSPENSGWDSFRPFLWKSLIVVGSDQGDLLAFDQETGKPAWSMVLEGDIRAIGGSEHFIYAGCTNGYLYAISPPF